jgi:hypothetical protein
VGFNFKVCFYVLKFWEFLSRAFGPDIYGRRKVSSCLFLG